MLSIWFNKLGKIRFSGVFEILTVFSSQRPRPHCKSVVTATSTITARLLQTCVAGCVHVHRYDLPTIFACETRHECNVFLRGRRVNFPTIGGRKNVRSKVQRVVCFVRNLLFSPARVRDSEFFCIIIVALGGSRRPVWFEM